MSSRDFTARLDTNGPLTGNLMSERVYELVYKAIVDGELNPGDKVVELEIARRLGTSQAPVREALRRLAQEGLLVHMPHRGNFVTEVSTEEIHASRQVRGVMEELAAQVVCSHLTAQQLADLEALTEEMTVAAEAKNTVRFRMFDIEFHRAVIRFAGNPVLVRAWQVVEPQLRSSRVLSDPLFRGSWRAMAIEHHELLDLLRGEDAATAGARFRAHAEGKVAPGLAGQD